MGVTNDNSLSPFHKKLSFADIKDLPWHLYREYIVLSIAD